MSSKRFIVRVVGGSTGLAAMALLAATTAGPASAHVTAQPGEATKGGYAKIGFRVPNESTTAGTVKLEVTFPLDTPIASIRTKPTPGWTAERTVEQLETPVESHGNEITEAVRTVTWTAEDGVRIGPGEFTEFEVTAGPLPDTDHLVLPAVQTYDDGEVVRWDAPPPAEGDEEPEHPAPTVILVDAGDGGHDSGDDTSASDSGNTGDDADETAAADSTDSTARLLAGAGLAVGALGLGLGVGGVFAGRRRAAGDRAAGG